MYENIKTQKSNAAMGHAMDNFVLHISIEFTLVS